MLTGNQTSYLEVYYIALQRYSRGSARPGYTSSIFDCLRHSKTSYPHINSLKENLQDPRLNHTNVLSDYFNSSETKFNSHSFALYLLDALESHFPEEKWGRFYPKNRRVIFYQGVVYRGTMQSPKSAFEHGIGSQESKSIEDYTCSTSLGIGVSTSKSFEIASRYAYAAVGFTRVEGYIYAINYRGHGGVDIVETHKARGNKFVFLGTTTKDLQEVNIIGSIKSEDIMGYYENGKLIPNPKYDAKRKTKAKINFHKRCALLFGEAIDRGSTSVSSETRSSRASLSSIDYDEGYDGDIESESLTVSS